MKKRLVSVLLASAMVLSSFGMYAMADETEAAAPASKSSEAAPDWDDYNEKIAEIYQETDLAKREALMHEAEDELMDTWAVIPIYFYNDIYMMNTECTGLYSNLFGFKYFAYMNTPDNTLNANLASEPDHLDPALNSSVDGACLAILAFSGLFAYDEEGQLIPELAEEMPEVSEDGLTYTFKIREGLKWSDGEPLDAEDIVYSWNRLADPNTAADYSYLCDSMNLERNDDGTLGIEASDDGLTFTCHLTQPCAYFLDLCAFPAFFPVPEQAVTEADPDGENPGAWALESGFVTSGPMTCTAWKHNESMTYEKNENYWNAENVTLDSINFMLSADDTAIYNAYNDGSLQFIDTVPNDEIANVINNEDFFIVPNLGTYYVAFNVNSPLFDGKTPEQAAAMRHAFSILIDRQYIVDAVGQTGQQPAGTFIPAGMADGQGGVFAVNDDDYEYPVTWDFNGEEAVGYFDPTATGVDNVDEARALLEEAGFEFGEDGMLSDSTPITVEYLTNDGTGHVAIAQSIQQDLAVVGINMEIKSEEWNVFLNDRKNGQFDFAREGWLADYNDPINMLEMWLTDSGNNDAQFGR
jgi:peptide/nickel transport system substrate-binding protein/oligopeptide transport system substrate-binding protein